jgi:primosomal protein N' (replication factor Y)
VRFHPVGIGIQKVEEDITRIFHDMHIFRIDSDTDVTKSEIFRHIDDADIILGTQTHISLLHHEDIAHIVFLLFESDLTLPDYRMEEDIYHILDYAKKSQKHVFIQTYTHDHPLLSLIIGGNYRDFLREMSQERKAYHYPPYGQFAVIRIHDSQKEKVQDIIIKMLNKIDILKTPDIFVAADKDIWERYAGEWLQKIILKGKDLAPILQALEIEIIRNRSVTLEWR